VSGQFADGGDVLQVWRVYDEEEDVHIYKAALRKGRILEIERGSSRSHYVENSIWNWLWTCRKTE
jgi:hypothetical protein